MDEIDRLLSEAGHRWRAAEPPAPAVDPSTLTRPGGRPFGAGLVASFAAGAGGAAVVLVIAGLGAQLGLWGDPGAPGSGNAGSIEPTAISSPAGGEMGCAVTRPNPPFAAPSPYPASAPDSLGGQAMLTGIEFPTAGCWQVTAQYRDAVLSYVVWITED